MHLETKQKYCNKITFSFYVKCKINVKLNGVMLEDIFIYLLNACALAGYIKLNLNYSFNQKSYFTFNFYFSLYQKVF